MLQTGMLLSDRYEIIEKVGSGGMSIVYKARCTKLERLVAIKVLRDDYCYDDIFVKKFKVEAQSAASLSHSNIVNIYDVGNDGNHHYIVMELLEGHTLKEYIREKGPLSNEETMKVSACIASALEQAHNNHIIHRDIKPQNIMLTKDGKIKVTDFGIARIATGATIAVSDVATGSVHYIPPEQAKGGHTDERSDIYALGITMFEMLTGQVPFQGDSEVSVALKQIHDPLPMPSRIIETADKNLEQIIIKATQKRPEMRYKSADDLLADLKKATNFPEEEFVHTNSIDEMGNTMVMSTSQMKQIWSDEDVLEDEMPMANRAVVVGGIMSAVILALLLVWFVFSMLNKEDEVPVVQLQIPNFVGESLDDAKLWFETNEIAYRIKESVFHDTISANHIIAQEPFGLAYLEKEQTVQLTLSKGSKLYETPAVEGFSFDVARETITNASLVYAEEKEYHDVVPIGLVISQEPSAGILLAEGSVVTITISIGKEEVFVTVPEVRNFPLEEAKKLLTDAKLRVSENISTSYHDVIEEGRVIFMTVLPGEKVKENYEIDLTISLGKEIKAAKKSMTINADVLGEKDSGVLRVLLKLNGEEREVYNAFVDLDSFPKTFDFEEYGSGDVEVYLDDVLEFINAIYFTDEVPN